MYCLNLLRCDRSVPRSRPPRQEGNSRQHDLGRAVPPGRYVFGHEASLATVRLGRLGRPREPKVADFDVAVGVQEQVRRLEVAVDHVGRVQRLDRPEGLICEVLHTEARWVSGVPDCGGM